MLELLLLVTVESVSSSLYDVHYYEKQKYEPGCWPGVEYAENGFFIIEQDIQFSLQCRKGYTRPFRSKEEWSCNSSLLRFNSPLSVEDKGTHVPSSCVAQLLPEEIYLQLEVTRETKDMPFCHRRSNKVAKLTVRIEGHDFTMDSEPSEQGCRVGFNIHGSFAKIINYWNFRMYHKPTKDHLPTTMLRQAQALLRSHVTKKMKETNLSKSNYEFEIGHDNHFTHGACRDGSMIEERDATFTTRIPICRMCENGMYLDKINKQCRPCKVGYTNCPGAVECKPCPVVVDVADQNADSITGCYVDIDTPPRRIDTIREGVIFFVVFHIGVLCVVTWSIRGYIHNIFQELGE